MRYIFIGDVHGCIEELNLLIAKLDLRPGDILIFVGDLVDRGPDSRAVIRRVRELLEQYPGSFAVAGNHESKVLEQRKKGLFKEPWTPDATEDEWEFLASLPLLKQLDVNGHQVTVVHAGFFPKFFDDYSEEGLSRIKDAWHKGGGKYMNRARRFLRVRFVNPEGNMVALGQEKSGDYFWAKGYDGREGYVFHGHQPYFNPPEPRQWDHAIGIDTGICFGGCLTAAVVTGNPREAEFVSVAALDVYAEPREDWIPD
jgi:predicted phosphodiesterase